MNDVLVISSTQLEDVYKEYDSNKDKIFLKDFLEEANQRGLWEFIPMPLPKVDNLNIEIKWDVISPTKE